MPQGVGEAAKGLCQVGSRETLAQKIGSSRLSNIAKVLDVDDYLKSIEK